MKVKSITNNLDEHLIRYIVSYACNFSCPDCYQEEKRKLKITTTREHIRKISSKINDLINDLINDNKPITFYPEGGEISLYNVIDDLLEVINTPKLSGLKIVSNFSTDLKWYNNLINYCKKRKLKLRLLLSYHPTQLLEEEFKKKLISLNYKEAKILIVVDNQNFKSHVGIINWLINNGFSFNINFKKYKEEINQDTKAFINFFMKEEKRFKVEFDNGQNLYCSGEQLRINNYFNPSGFMCDNNKNFDILPDGTLKHFACPMDISRINILKDDISSFNTKDIYCQATERRRCNISCANHNIWMDN